VLLVARIPSYDVRPFHTVLPSMVFELTVNYRTHDQLTVQYLILHTYTETNFMPAMMVEKIRMRVKTMILLYNGACHLILHIASY